MRKLALAGLLCSAWMFSSILSAAEDRPSDGSVKDDSVIAVGDTLDIVVYKAPDLSVQVKVPESGEVLYPILGRMTVAGMSTGQVAGRIADELERRGHLHSPEVSATITRMAEYRIFLLGAVKDPGPIVVSRARPLYLTQAIALVGGFAAAADRGNVRIVRRPLGGKAEVLHVDVDAVLEKGRAEEDIRLADGDTVFVAQVEAIYVYGQVNTPGAYRPPPGVEATVSRIVSLAGGTTRFARTNKTRVIHRNADKQGNRIETVDLKAVVESGMIEKDARVYPGDIIFVPETIF
ncbi:MAG: polysaccharide biosynthesis/export family protein [Planctomycetes bacterium]|nr:polysaccharide biosynthesis/export family protein [Planctomycetota bacterium]